MTKTSKTRRKMQMRMRRAFKKAARLRKQHQKAVAAYKKMQRKYRAA